MYEVSWVRPEEADDVFLYIVDYMERLERRFHGRDKVDRIMKDVDDEVISLWVVFAAGKGIAGFFTLGMEDTGYRKVCRVLHVGGKDMVNWIDTVMDTVEAFATDNGCDVVETYGRPGWAKFYRNRNARKTTETYEFKLRKD